jgi:predicted lipid-binding transport protein (Tim44 family)
MKLWTALLTCALMVATLDGHAASRLGGGKSIGQQSTNVTQRQSTAPATGAAPAGTQAPAATSAARPATQPAAVPAAAKRPWGAMLGGLAAGLGLAWLANSLGLGAEFGQFFMIALLALVIMVVVGAVMRARRGTAASVRSPYAFHGAGAPADLAMAPRQYSPDKVGNDASARPWENSTTAFDAGRAGGGSGLQVGSALAGAQGWGVPAGFDVAGFVEAAKRNFITLQDAWDRSDVATLRAMMTDEMTGEIRSQLAERETQAAGQPNKTEVAMLEAQFLGIEEQEHAYLASIEFSGMIREDASAGPSPFREVWNMTKPKDGSQGWLVAGVQALQ